LVEILQLAQIPGSGRDNAGMRWRQPTKLTDLKNKKESLAKNQDFGTQLALHA
jgi:hypothetical protein